MDQGAMKWVRNYQYRTLKARYVGKIGFPRVVALALIFCLMLDVIKLFVWVISNC